MYKGADTDILRRWCRPGFGVVVVVVVAAEKMKFLAGAFCYGAGYGGEERGLSGM